MQRLKLACNLAGSMLCNVLYLVGIHLILSLKPDVKFQGHLFRRAILVIRAGVVHLPSRATDSASSGGTSILPSQGPGNMVVAPADELLGISELR